MMGCSVPTGVGAAIRSAGVRPGDRVAVIGALVAGAAGLLAVDPMEVRRARARDLGATHAVAPDEFAAQYRDLDVVIDGTADLDQINDVVALQQQGAVVRTILHGA